MKEHLHPKASLPWKLKIEKDLQFWFLKICPVFTIAEE